MQTTNQTGIAESNTLQKIEIKILTFQKIIKALGVEWHEEHFVCTICKKSLAGSSFLEKDGQPYCTTDYYNIFADRCAACKQPITQQAIIALDGKWHQSCFICYVSLNFLFLNKMNNFVIYLYNLEM